MFEKKNISRWSVALLAASALLAYAPRLFAQSLPKFALHLEEPSVRVGENLRILVEARLDVGWYLYALQNGALDTASEKGLIRPIEIKIENAEALGLVPLTPWYETPPSLKQTPLFPKPLYIHLGRATFYRNFRLGAATKPREPLKLTITYQTCNNKICLPPKQAMLSLPLAIAPGPPRPERLVLNKTVGALPSTNFGLWGLEGSGWSWFALCFLAGVLALGTPCVLPVLPLVFHYLSSHRGGIYTQIAPFLVFLLGIMVVYTSLGLLLSVLLGPFAVQNFATHPLTNVLAGLLFTIFALSLLGLIRLKLPPSFLGLVEKWTHTKNFWLSAFFIGFSFTLSSFTCNIQIIGALLVTAAGGALFKPALGMALYALGFATPFALVFFVPSSFQGFKKISQATFRLLPLWLGFIELLVALKFFLNADLGFKQIVSRDISLFFLLLVTALTATGILWAGFKRFEKPIKQRWVVSELVSLCLLLVLFSLFYHGLGNYTLGHRLDALLPPASAELKGGDYVSSQNRLVWLDSTSDAIKIASAAHKPIFIDFTGYTCTNCRWMESYIFREQNVYKILNDNFVLVRLYTDLGPRSEANQAWQFAHFQVVALPFYALLQPTGETYATEIGLVEEPNDFIQFLNSPKPVL